MRPVVLVLAFLGSALGAGLVPSVAGAQSGSVYVPPGYGANGTGTGATGPGATGTVTTSSGTVITGTVTAIDRPSTVVPITAPPPTPHLETRTRQTSIRSLWLPGLIALPVSWLLTWTISSTGLPLTGDAIEFSFLPAIGPWLMLTQPLNGYEGFAVAMGLVQDAALIMLVLGLVLREEVTDEVWVMADLGEGRRLSFDASAGPSSASFSTTLTF